ncbi:MAG: sugar porter family MFS transporter [Janthinobacterium lividum]
MRFFLLSAVASLGGLLFGYDTGVISGALLFLRARFALSPTMQDVVTGIVLVGATVGAAGAGALSDRFGRRPVIVWVAVLFAAGALLSGLAGALWVLLAARLLVGLAIGVASMLTPLYLSEIAPAEKRGAVVSLNQFCITFGILLSYVVDYALAGTDGGWRWMLGLGVVPGLALAAGMLVLPESPRWLAARGRTQDAERALRFLRGHGETAGELAALKQDLRHGGQDISLRRMLRTPQARRPLVVGVGLAVFQQVTGINTVIYFAPTIVQSAGLASASAAILATVGIGAVNVAMTLVAMRLIDHAGRRVLLLAGMGVMAAALLVLAGAFLLGAGPGLAAVTVGALGLYIAGFAVGLGPVFWLLIAEIFPLAVRGRGMSTASVANWGSNLAVTLVFLDLVRALGSGGTFLVFAAMTLAAIAFTWRLVPETRGRSLEQIESDLAETHAG